MRVDDCQRDCGTYLYFIHVSLEQEVFPGGLLFVYVVHRFVWFDSFVKGQCSLFIHQKASCYRIGFLDLGLDGSLLLFF